MHVTSADVRTSVILAPTKIGGVMRALLISNSGRPFLVHCREAIDAFLAPARRVAFVSAAAYGAEEAYCSGVRDALQPLGITVDHLHTERDSIEDLLQIEAVFVGGGNTYHLLRRLREAGWIEALRTRVQDGTPYIGSSAGSNLAGPNILTTNDWNVDGSTQFEALGIVPFNINPHYQETDPTVAPFAETRDERIEQYLHVRDNAVVGIEEQTWIRCEGEGDATVYRVGGAARARLFRSNEAPRDYQAGEALEI
jgi:dipeptidase E